MTLVQNQCNAKSEIFVFLDTSDKFSRSYSPAIPGRMLCHDRLRLPGRQDALHRFELVQASTHRKPPVVRMEVQGKLVGDKKRVTFCVAGE